MPGEMVRRVFVFSIKFKIKKEIRHEHADIIRATSTGIPIAVVIAGALIITWYSVCHNTTPHETPSPCTTYPLKNNKSIHPGEIER